MNSAEFVFHLWPWSALALCAAGVCVRALVMSPDGAAERRAVAGALDDLLGGRLQWGCVSGLAAGHLAALLAPWALVGLGAVTWRLVLLEATGIGLGLAALAAWVRALLRALRSPGRSLVTDLGEPLFLAVLGVAVASGVGTALVHRWGSSWSAVTVTPWARSLTTGRPAVELVAGLPSVVRLHLFASFAALAAFPLSRAGALPILALRRAAALAARLARRGLDRLDLGRHGRRLATRLWPEPEIHWVGASASRGAVRPLPSSSAHPLPGRPDERALRVSGSKT
jgi:nitrate reductase gamma subunit